MAVKDFIHNCLIQKGEQIIGHISRELENYYDADDVGIYETNKDYSKINNYKRNADGTIRKHDASSDKLKSSLPGLHIRKNLVFLFLLKSWMKKLACCLNC